MNQKVRVLRETGSDASAQRRRVPAPEATGEMPLVSFPDCVVMPSQFFSRHRSAESEGERRLMLAVVEEAINCFCKTSLARDAHRMKLHQGAENWLFSDDRSWFFSFANICDVLGLDADCLRETLAEWKRAQVAARNAAQRSFAAASIREPTYRMRSNA